MGPPGVHAIIDIDGRIVFHGSGKKELPPEIVKELAENGGRLAGAQPRPTAPHPGHPPGWHSETQSKREAFHNLLTFYHKLERWDDALQLMGQHRQHLATPPLIRDAVAILTAAKKADANPATIRLLAKHLREKELDGEASAARKKLLPALDKLLGK